MKNKVIYTIFIILLLEGMIILNIQIMQRNETNTGWDEMYPITTSENVKIGENNLDEVLQQKVNKTEYATTSTAGLVKASNDVNVADDGTMSVPNMASESDLNIERERINQLINGANNYYTECASTDTGALLVVDSGAITGQINIADVTPHLNDYTPQVNDYVNKMSDVLTAGLNDIKTAADGIVYHSAGDAVRGQFTTLKDTISVVQDEFSYLNLFDKTAITSGYYVDVNGELVESEVCFASDYIDVERYTSIKCSKTHRISFYSSSKLWLSNPDILNSLENDITITIPSNVKYLRFSSFNDNINTAQIGKNVDRNNYYQYGKYKMKGLIVSGEEFKTVSKSGNGDYTSLLHALRSCDCDLYVLDGTFDIVQEYKNEFSSSYFNDDYTERYLAGNFMLGLYVNERKLIFSSGTSIVMDLTDYNVSYSESNDRRYSAFIIGSNAYIEGCHVIGTKNWYVIHDDGGYDNTPFTNTFKNCIIEAVNIVNNNAIGGGLRARSTIIYDNCYINDGTDNVNNKTVRYHNCDWAPNAIPIEGTIIIKNCYTNGCIFLGYLGTQTTKAKAIINNCSMGSTIDVSAQVEGASENIELLEWRNDVRQ